MAKLRDVVLSVSAGSCYEKCPWNFMLRYEMGWRPDKDKKVFRLGTGWHHCHEIGSSEAGGKCWRCIQKGSVDSDCYMCGGTGMLPEDLVEAVVTYLDYYYGDMPENFDKLKWDTEKFTVLYAYCGHRWYFPEDEFEEIASEIVFSLPIINPKTGRKVASCRLDGMIDALWRHRQTGLVYVGERKSTGSSIGPDGEFWQRLDLDSQVTTYLLAARTLQLSGELECYGIGPNDPAIKGAYYDVWHKPDIAPKLLTQGETKAFIAGTQTLNAESQEITIHEYFNADFDVEALEVEATEEVPEPAPIVMVNGERTEVKPGKQGFAIRETAEMYGNRLLADITERPEFYFEQREIVKSDAELVEFQADCCKRVELIRHTRKKDLWRRHGGNCKRPFKCDYFAACHNFGEHPLDPMTPPEGYVATHKHKNEEE